jgi:signal transduction histidine kinase
VPARFAVEADPDQLYRILVNLMRNARQAIEADPGRPAERRGKGAVTVSAFGQDGVCVVRIADDGPGIPPRLAERLFEPFVSSKSSDGSGLGLTISRELAALHGGELRLVPGDGSGAVFELRLPA